MTNDKRLRRTALTAQLLCAAVLVVLALVCGTRRGVWDGSRFYEASRGEPLRYARSGSAAVEIAGDTLRVLSDQGQTADFTFRTGENGSYRSVRLAWTQGDEVLNTTYIDGRRVDDGQGGRILSDRIQETRQFSAGLSDDAVCRMALGEQSSRIAAQPGLFLLGALLMVLGMAVTLLMEPLMRLDRYLIGFFYKDADRCQPTGLARGCWIVLSTALFVIGAVGWGFVLFG